MGFSGCYLVFLAELYRVLRGPWLVLNECRFLDSPSATVVCYYGHPFQLLSAGQGWRAGGGGLGGQRTRARLSSVDLTPPSTLPTHSTPYPFPLMRTHFSSRILSVCVFPVLRVYCVYTSAFRNFFCYLAFRFLNHSLSISREAESVQLDYYRIGKRFSSQWWGAPVYCLLYCCGCFNSTQRNCIYLWFIWVWRMSTVLTGFYLVLPGFLVFFQVVLPSFFSSFS